MSARPEVQVTHHHQYMIPVCATTLSSFVWEDSIAPSVGSTLKKNKEGKENFQGKEAQAAKAFGASAFRAKRQRQNTGFVGKAGFFGVVHIGQVRVSTVVFVLCLLEAILWTSCLLSSSSALKTDALETEHYLVRETENLKSSLTCKSCDKLVSSLPLQRSSEPAAPDIGEAGRRDCRPSTQTSTLTGTSR